ncbi:hypothetical protein HCK04_30585 [Microbispora sp. CL1-1]|nr:hypothetical protein [Microbispora sp. SCL1-1]NJP28468.1 hypothetical protein [Microbispora sp. CL1-1]
MEAFHASDTLLDVVPVTRRSPGTLGAVVSPPLPPIGFHSAGTIGGSQPVSDVCAWMHS